MTDLASLPVTTLQGEPTTFGELTGGKAALVVNVASRCGLTPQYTALERLQADLGPSGFAMPPLRPHACRLDPSTAHRPAVTALLTDRVRLHHAGAPRAGVTAAATVR